MRVSAVVVVACIASHEHSVNGFALSAASGRLAARQSAISQSMTRQRSSCAQRCSMAASAHSSSSSSEHRLTTMQAAAASAAADASKPLRLGVLLMNLGGPERLEH
eukprot:1938-Heterococcus_DN1.PRE.4